MTRVQLLLVQLAEEAAEVQQEIAKALRFGPEEIMTGQSLTNVERIDLELADMLALIEMLKAEGIFKMMDPFTLNRRVNGKKEKVEHYLKFSAECGVLQETPK